VSAQANKQMVQNIYEALDGGERTAFLEALHDDFVMQVMGSSSWSQTVRGKRKC
jgi:ketosteroid isomerase-like protein